MDIRKDDCRCKFADRPLKRTIAELYCLSLVFRFWEDNNDSRKLATILVVVVWAAIEIGSAFGFANPPQEFFYIRVGVGVLIGRMWGIQINNFAGIEFAPINNENNGDDSNE